MQTTKCKIFSSDVSLGVAVVASSQKKKVSIARQWFDKGEMHDPSLALNS